MWLLTTAMGCSQLLWKKLVSEHYYSFFGGQKVKVTVISYPSHSCDRDISGISLHLAQILTWAQG